MVVVQCHIVNKKSLVWDEFFIIFLTCSCSIEEIKALREAHAQFQASLSSAQADFEALAALDQQIKSYNVGPNPYTWFTMEALEDTWQNLQKIIKVNQTMKACLRSRSLGSI